ncbi:MAG: Wadjet anti-phage system protein JetD domain-containing protein [Syntrophomonas sp.]
MNYKKVILNYLLDKYEKSAHFTGKAKVNRRIIMPASDIPSYTLGDRPDIKEQVHQIIYELHNKQFIEIIWVRGAKTTLLDMLVLQLDKIDEVYYEIGREPLCDRLEFTRRELGRMIANHRDTWIGEGLAALIPLIINKIPPPLPADAGQQLLFFRCLNGLQDKGQTELLERIFSIKYLGNSKNFAEIKPTLLTFARMFYFPATNSSEDELLAELGIIKMVDPMLFAGPLIINLDGQKLDCTPCTSGMVVDANHQPIIEEVKAIKILTIENKTNFHYLANQPELNQILKIYTGGFPGPNKRQFLSQIASVAPTVEWYHWGDIDWGGFAIYHCIQAKAVNSLIPVFMDDITLLEYRQYGEPLTRTYRNKLQNAGQTFDPFKKTIECMLKEDMRLEQEALLTDSKLIQKLSSQLLLS